MTQGLARYHSRLPRYILNTDDEFLIRVAGPRQIPWEEGTEIQNVSLTGLAFTAPDDLCPILGEVIRIQFSVPGGNQMACHGIVTRLENAGRNSMLVAVHFYKLEMSHRIALAQGLSRKFHEHKKNRVSEGEIALANAFPKIMIMAGFLGLWLIMTFIFYSQ